MRVSMIYRPLTRRSSVLTVLACGGLLAFANTALAAGNLVGWWNLDDGSGATAADSSPAPAGGSANDGTLRNYPDDSNWNAGLTGDSDGITMPHGLKFDGGPNQGFGDTPASQHVDLDAHVADFAAMTQGSISLWFRHDKGLTSDHSMFGMANDVDNSMARLQWEYTPQNTRVIRATDNDIPGGVSSDMDVPIADDGNWHHVVFTSDGANSQLFVDGILEETGAQDFLNTPSADFLSLGFTNRGGRPLWYYLGTMGDVRIYDDVLNQGQINYLAKPDNYGDGLALEIYPLLIQVNKTTGAVALMNNYGETTEIDFYGITSPDSSLDPGEWTSLQDQEYDGSPGNPVWGELGTLPTELSEGRFGGGTQLADGTVINLGDIYTGGNAEDLVFEFRTKPDGTYQQGGVVYLDQVAGSGDMDGNGTLDDVDVNLFVMALTDRASYESLYPTLDADVIGNVNLDAGFDLGDVGPFKALFALEATASAVPEPASCVLLLTLAIVGVTRRRR